MIELLNAISQQWWGWVWSMFWQAGLLILVIGCVDLLIRKWAWPQLRYALWSLILIKLILPPMWSLPTGLAPHVAPWIAQAPSRAWSTSEDPGGIDSRLAPAWARAHPAIPPSPGIGAEQGLLADGMADGPVAGVMTSAGTVSHVERSAVDMGGSTPQQGPGLDWRVYAMGLWLLGVMGVGGFLVVRLRSLVTGASCGSAEHCVPQSFYNQMAQCAGRLGLGRLPRVAPTQRLSSPAVFGLTRPVLLMPVGYLSRLSRKDAEHVLLHELAHVKRGDLWMHGLVLLLQVVYWYNPLLWLVRRRVHQLRELCCDATVAGLLREDTPAYRQTLVETARRFLATRSEPGLGLLGLFEDTHLLLARLNWLERPTWRYRRMKRAFVVALMALMLACVLPMAQAQPQHKPVPEHAVTVPHQDSEPLASLAVPEGQSSDSFEQQMEQLQEQMKQLQQQMQQLVKQREELARQQAHAAEQQAEVARQMAERARHIRLSNASARFTPYIVKEGDTLAKIVDANFPDMKDRDKVRESIIDAIKQANNLGSTDSLRPGQKLWLPSTVDMPPEETDPVTGINVRHTPGAMSRRPGVPRVSTSVPGVPRAPAAPGPHVNTYKAEITRTGNYVVKAIQPETVLKVENLVGSITITGGEGSDCTVNTTVRAGAATKERAEEMASKIQIRVTPEDGVVHVTADVPEELRGNKDGEGIEVGFEITVPAHVRVQVSQEVGNVTVSSLSGDVGAKTNVGAIHARGLKGGASLTTNVGNINLTLPTDVSAKIKAKTEVGAVTSTVPLDVTNKAELPHGDVSAALGSIASGTLGDGEHKIDLVSKVGLIRIQSESDSDSSTRF
jgi:beta-lactamase regulating signal transducer with metallopeptidase domain